MDVDENYDPSAFLLEGFQNDNQNVHSQAAGKDQVINTDLAVSESENEEGDECVPNAEVKNDNVEGEDDEVGLWF